MQIHNIDYRLIILLLIFSIQSCRQNTTLDTNTTDSSDPIVEQDAPRVPDWHKNANIYEVNLRQYTAEGTFAAFQAELPRLRDMGVKILWFMPIQPISQARRKGTLGSPYAVADYYDVNPEFGNMTDFKNLLDAIHAAGMYAIIDWVPNHSGWDNPWITEHPEYYTKDADGNITDPINPETGKSWGWTDVADFDYTNEGLQQAMIDAMQFWVTDVKVDGFRVDVAHGVPVEFWERASDSLYAIKPLFMLAEAEVPALLNTGAFIMDYGWEMHHLLNDIARSQLADRGANKLVDGNLVGDLPGSPEKKNSTDIDELLARKAEEYDHGYQMNFTSNHDENSWSGTEMQRMGDGHQTFAVLTATMPGMPLIYSGQESAMNKQLEFFEKDVIDWGEYEYADFYQKLLALKKENKALWNGTAGGPLVKIPTTDDKAVYAFMREKDDDRVVVILNLSAYKQKIKLKGDAFVGDYTNVFSKGAMGLNADMKMELAPWEYIVLEK